MKRRTANWMTVTLLLVSLLLVSTVGGAAQAACTPLATGLVAPRYLAVADDGTVYVTEAGAGGAEPVPTPPGEGPGGPPGTRGLTGQVTRIAPGGAKTVVARNLPSYFQPAEGSTGPGGIVLAGGALLVAVGGAGPATPRLTPLPNENAVVRIDLQTGAVAQVADIGAYERARNPEPYTVDSNLYGMALGADGLLYVADAGGNALYRVDPRGGALVVAAVLPGLPATAAEFPPGLLPPGAPFANPSRGGTATLDPVPTGVAVGPDGAVYVANLSGFPFIAGKAKVLRVAPGGALGDAATGLTMAVGVAFGPDGLLYASQISTGFRLTGPDTPPTIAPGPVVRVRPDGTKEVVAENLNAPNGIAFDKAGNLYIVANSAFGPPNQGQVLRCTGVVAPSTVPAPPATGNGGTLPGLPNTGAGGGNGPAALPLALLGAAVLGGLLVARRRAARR